MKSGPQDRSRPSQIDSRTPIEDPGIQTRDPEPTGLDDDGKVEGQRYSSEYLHTSITTSVLGMTCTEVICRTLHTAAFEHPTTS